MDLAIVYKSGGDYDIQYVKAIVQALRSRGGYEGEICCFTDEEAEVNAIDGVTAISLLHDWPGWWSKIELFRPGIFKGSVLYLDLDTFILKDLHLLRKLCEENGLPLFVRGAPEIAVQNDWLASPIMSWKGDHLRRIYDIFKESPRGHMGHHRRLSIKAGQKGDQGFIRLTLERTGCGYEFFQDLLPKNYIMFKRHVMTLGMPYNDCHILNWSGKRRPHKENNPFHSIWKKDVADYVRTYEQA